MKARTTRRDVVKAIGAIAAAGFAIGPARAQARGRIVIVGGGFGGATCARYLRRLAPELEVSLVEPSTSFVTCPFSNTVIGGLNDIGYVTHSYDGLKSAGVRVVTDRVAAIDPASRNVRLANGSTIPYDRLVVSPGIDFKWGAIEGYDEAAAEVMPHAYKAGPQTVLLRRQLEAMPDNGVFVMSIPANPFRCPPGPYERASLVANYFKTAKPRAKIILVDQKDSFSKMGLFREGWAQLYPNLEWVAFAKAGTIRRVDPRAKTIYTDFLEQKGDVVNVIPPQRSGLVVDTAGLADGGDWCMVNPATFESRVVPGIHVLGDAIIAGAMPKSGFSAGSQGKVCAYAIVALQRGQDVATPTYLNTCYSLLAPDYGISVADTYRIAADGTITAVPGGGVSPTGASAAFRALEAGYARSWYANITKEMFG
jgi:sulfide dehydrogenase [flavocytochrome c] flavoprotein subunit